jgi:beta-glucosidase
MPWAVNYEQLESITGSGLPLAESALTQSASRVLEQKYRFKIAKLSDPIGLRKATTTLSDAVSIEQNDDHIALAQEAAIKSMVLLKNDKNTLPISRSGVKTVAVIGAEVPYDVAFTQPATGTIHFATDPRLGDLGSSRVFADPNKSTGPAAGIAAAAGSGINVVSGSDPTLADQADFVVVVAGLTPQDEGEEYTGAGDRSTFALDGKSMTNPQAQNNLITQVAAKGKPMVVVLEGGSVIDMPWLNQVPAVVMAWYPGMVVSRNGRGARARRAPLWRRELQRQAAHHLAEAVERRTDVERRHHDPHGLLSRVSIFRQEGNPAAVSLRVRP